MFSRGSSLMDPSGLVTLRNWRLLLVSISILRASACSTSSFFLEYFSILIPEVNGFHAVFASEESSPFLGLDWKKKQTLYLKFYSQCRGSNKVIFSRDIFWPLQRSTQQEVKSPLHTNYAVGAALRLCFKNKQKLVENVLHAIYLHKCHPINLYSWHMQDSYLYAS